MKKIISKAGILTVIVFALTACYPGGAEYTSDTDIVITDYDEQYNFNAIKTYFMSDSVNQIVAEGKEPDHSSDAFIIGELETNFNNLGWTRIVDSTSAEPDVAVVVAAVKVKNYNIYTMPWYGGWGWGWYWKSTGEITYWGYPGYGWGYPPYYGGTYVTTYETGTLAWYLFDPKLVDENNENIILQWGGAVNGVLGSSATTTQDRVIKGIDQAFRQSPYLSE